MQPDWNQIVRIKNENHALRGLVSFLDYFIQLHEHPGYSMTLYQLRREAFQKLKEHYDSVRLWKTEEGKCLNTRNSG